MQVLRRQLRELKEKYEDQAFGRKKVKITGDYARELQCKETIIQKLARDLEHNDDKIQRMMEEIASLYRAPSEEYDSSNVTAYEM